MRRSGTSRLMASVTAHLAAFSAAADPSIPTTTRFVAWGLFISFSRSIAVGHRPTRASHFATVFGVRDFSAGPFDPVLAATSHSRRLGDTALLHPALGELQGLWAIGLVTKAS